MKPWTPRTATTRAPSSNGPGKSSSPIQWAGVLLGVLCGTLALVVGVWATVFWGVNGDFPGQLYLGGLVLGVLAVQGFILALVGEYLGRIQRDVEGRPLYTIERELV